MGGLGSFFTVLASLVGAWAFVKYVLLVEIRVDASTFKAIYDYFRDEPKFILSEEFTSETRHPVQFAMMSFSRKSPWFYLNHSERLMQAGWQGKEHVTVLSCPRWRYGRVKAFLSVELKESSFRTNGVPVQVLMPWGMDRIGSLKCHAPEPARDRCEWEDIDVEVGEVAAGSRQKTGAILFGPPGNGKTSFVRHLATKHRLPIVIFTLDPQWGNHDLMLMFSGLPQRCILLMEDFDNYYKGRNCLLQSSPGQGVRFTYDVILNGLDGVYNTYAGVVFVMTVNDIDSVDEALKNRPSRFKFTRLFGNPSAETRKSLLGDWSEPAHGLNLDQVFRLSEYKAKGLSLSDSLQRLKTEVKSEG